MDKNPCYSGTDYSGTTQSPAIAGWVLDGPAIAGDQGFKGSKKEGPGHFMVNFGGGLYVVRFWVDRL